MSRIIIKNSTTAGNIPSSLAVGELAINTTDGKLYYSNGSTVKLLATSGSGGGGGGTGTVTSVQLANGTGISLSGTNPITTAGTITITNTAPDQTVVLNNGAGISVTGTYPTFTITNTINTGSLLTTGSSNVTQTISGSLTINQNLTVLGSSSIQYITASQLNIGTNIITVNTSTPAVRFGGLAVFDSGSAGTGRTGSILWDSQNDVWVYSNPSGAAYDGALLLVGPRNTTGLGNEAGINTWYAAIGNGSHHMTSSQIYNSGSLIRLETNTQITGSLFVSAGITGSLFSVVSGSSTELVVTGTGVTIGNTATDIHAITGSLGIQGLTSQAPLQISSGSTSLLFISSSGRIGIGTNSPNTICQINLTNTDFTNTNGAGSHIYMTNPSATGQNVVSSFIGGALVAKWRTDFVGNISWVAGSGGAHDFYTGGDFSIGSIKMRIFNGGNVQIATSPVGGANADAGFKLDVQGTGRFTGTLTTAGGTISSTILSNANQILAGTNTATAAVYRNTNTGAPTTAQFVSDRGTTSQGDRTLHYDGVTDGLVFGAYNSNVPARTIARAGIQITNLTNTANSEAGDLIFLTQTGGTAMSEKMRIRGNGNVVIGSTLNYSQKLFVEGNVGWGSTSTLQSSGFTTSRGIALQIGGTATYRTTNAGADLTPVVNIAPNGANAGALSLNYDFNNGLGLNFAAGNGTNIIARASIQMSGSNNTAGSEAGDLLFLTQTGGTAMSEKMRITGAGTVIITGSVAIGTGSIGSGESNLVLGPAPAGGTGEGGQLALLGTGSFTSSSFIDTYQNQIRILAGQGTTSAAGVLAINLGGNRSATFQGPVTASGFSGLPNDYLYVTRNTDQTVVTNWVSTDIIFNNSVVSKGISYNTGTGLATLTGGKVYRITSRLAWSAAAAYLLEYSCYDSANTQIGPTTQIVQSTNGSNNISDGTLEFIYAPVSNTDIKIRTTANTTALSGEKIRGDLNTQLIIQQIA